jgi:hypothetical protein
MREVTLERVKRDAKKSPKTSTDDTAAIKLAQIKSDFENIQTLLAEIIKTYTTGDKIDYLKISEYAAEVQRRSIRLRSNLFIIKADKINSDKGKDQESPKAGEAGVRELIIELDRAIGEFVENPIFKSKNLVAQKDAEASRACLENIIEISTALSSKAKAEIN